MRIVRLAAENVKRLKAVEIKPDGRTVIIGGRNAQGKTSVLDSIAYALGGKELCPSMPVRKGEKKASVTVDLGEMTVERTFTEAGGGTLTVRNKEGFKATSPQAVLDKLVGRLSFDPLAFTHMDARKQADTLRQLVGLDFAEHDAKRRGIYDQRTEHARAAKQLEARLAAILAVDAPDAEVSVSALMANLKVAQEHNSELDELDDKYIEERETIDGAERAIRHDEDSISRIEGEIEELQNSLKGLRDAIEENKTVISKAKAKVSALAKEKAAFKLADTAEIERQISESDGINAKVRQKKARAELAEQVKAAKAKVEADTKHIEGLDDAKGRALASAKFPVPGLSFDNCGVTFNGVPFEQASQAEQLRVSVAMGLALNPKLRVILIRDGSLLDADNLKLIAEMAEANDAQIWVERVGDGDKCAVVIEDGSVKANGKA